MARKRGFVPERPLHLETRAVPTAVVHVGHHVVPYLSLTSYNQTVLDIQGDFGGYLQTQNLVIGSYGPIAALYQSVEHAIQPIPYNRVSGLDATVKAIIVGLRPAAQEGNESAIAAAEESVLFALQANVDSLAASNAIKAGSLV
jgi:hypothetical protein